MGTRGAYGFRRDKTDKVTYNHFDSYPSYLGANIMEFVQNNSDETMNDMFDKMIMVDQGENIPLAIKLEHNLGKDTDWYQFLREGQGDLERNKTIRFMIDSKDFLTDSLFCEYAYIINLSTKCLEIYKGFNKDPKARGRYAKIKDASGFNSIPNEKPYYGIVLVRSISFKVLRRLKDANAFMTKLEKKIG